MFAIVPAWVVSAAAEAFTSAVVAATKHKPVHRDARLDDGWRFVLAVLGLALIVLGIDLWVSPPSHKAFAPSATMKGAIGNVETPSDTLSGVLLGLGAVLVLAAANGVKVASVKFGDTEVDWMDIAAAKAKDAGTTAKAKAIAAGLSVERQAEASVSAATLAYERASQEIRGIDPEAIAAEAVEAVRHQA